MTHGPKRKLSFSLALSHLVVTSFVGLTAAVVVYAVFFWVEDRSYRSIVQASLDAAMGGREVSTEGPLRVHPLEASPPDLRARGSATPDGLFEWDHQGLECHVGLGTSPDGTRWVAVLESGEIDQGPRLALVFAAALLAISLGAIAFGIRVARRTLAPLEDLTERLREGQRPVVAADTAMGSRDDEVAFLAQELERYLQEREQTLAREGEFLRDTSHELRNPLSVLHGGLELLRETGQGDSAAFRERLDRMERSVSRMRSTVETLLHIARQEGAAAPAGRRPLGEGVADLIAEFQPLAARSVTLRFVNNGLPEGSNALWLVILRNLLDNAIHATDSGSITLRLGLREVDVEDSGGGMDPELKARYAESFVQGTGSPGFGLGLAIVYRLAKRMGWTLSLEDVGDGTRVRLRRKEP